MPQQKLLVFAIFLAAACFSEAAMAQFANATVQLPTFRTTQFNSSFSVPDGGTISLGSIGRRDYLPGAISGSTGSATASARVLIMQELEQEMLFNLAIANPPISPAATEDKRHTQNPIKSRLHLKKHQPAVNFNSAFHRLGTSPLLAATLACNGMI